MSLQRKSMSRSAYSFYSQLGSGPRASSVVQILAIGPLATRRRLAAAVNAAQRIASVRRQQSPAMRQIGSNSSISAATGLGKFHACGVRVVLNRPSPAQPAQKVDIERLLAGHEDQHGEERHDQHAALQDKPQQWRKELAAHQPRRVADRS